MQSICKHCIVIILYSRRKKGAPSRRPPRVESMPKLVINNPPNHLVFSCLFPKTAAIYSTPRHYFSSCRRTLESRFFCFLDMTTTIWVLWCRSSPSKSISNVSIYTTTICIPPIRHGYALHSIESTCLEYISFVQPMAKSGFQSRRHWHFALFGVHPNIL